MKVVVDVKVPEQDGTLRVESSQVDVDGVQEVVQSQADGKDTQISLVAVTDELQREGLCSVSAAQLKTMSENQSNME